MLKICITPSLNNSCFRALKIATTCLDYPFPECLRHINRGIPWASGTLLEVYLCNLWRQRTFKKVCLYWVLPSAHPQRPVPIAEKDSPRERPGRHICTQSVSLCWWIFVDVDERECPQNVVLEVVEIFRHCCEPLEVTHGVPQDGSFRFIDLGLIFSNDHARWKYERGTNKPLLSYKSAHSKLVKRAIANLCLTTALEKSCYHFMNTSLNAQVNHMSAGGYPPHLVVPVAERLKKVSV